LRISAEICSAKAFAAQKADRGWHMLGVLGFAGRWERSGLTGEALAGYVTEARQALQGELVRCQEAHGGRLLVCTGATNTGVLQLAYELCAALGLETVSVAPDRALNYELGSLNYVIPMGESFGEESEWFVHLCDEFLLLGGGKQSQRELLMAGALGKPITIIQGFGGCADELTAVELPAARFI
jgi:hypothetical protein